MKRVLASVLVMVVALSLVACNGTGTSGGTGGGDQKLGGSTGVGDKKTVATVDALKAALKADHSKAEWYPDVKGVTTETRLGAEILVLQVGWGMADADWEMKQRKSNAIRAAIQSYDCPLATNVGLADADGNRQWLGSTSEYGAAPMATAFKLPAAPQTIAELKTWLAAVYGPGGLIKLGSDEKWYASITSIGPGKDGATVSIVTTLPENDKAELDALQRALQTSGSALLSMVSITGNSNYISMSAPAGQPGMNGYYYPAK